MSAQPHYCRLSSEDMEARPQLCMCCPELDIRDSPGKPPGPSHGRLLPGRIARHLGPAAVDAPHPVPPALCPPPGRRHRSVGMPGSPAQTRRTWGTGSHCWSPPCQSMSARAAYPHAPPLVRMPNLRVPRAPALSVLLDSFLFRLQEVTSGSEQDTLLKRIL